MAKLTAQQYADRYKQSNQLPNTTQQNTGLPQPQNSQEWDYKKSLVNQKGEPLPSGAEGWTPFGTPYFGKGLSGTLKKYAWQLMGSPTQGNNEERWARFLELTTSNTGGEEAMKESPKLLFQGMRGTDATKETAVTDWNAVKEANARIKQITEQYKDPTSQLVNVNTMPADVAAEYKQLQTTILDKSVSAGEGATSNDKGQSLLSPLLRGSKVAFEALTDVLSEAAIKFEQVQGASAAMKDYADQNGTQPDLAFDVDRKSEDKAEAWQNSLNLASRLLVAPLRGWDAFRFVTAPGTLKEKTKAVQEGWDAGRILYSQAIKPALLEEYKRRVASGEDAQLVAMELQNPWAEMAGQMVLDPLNMIGMFSKGAKAAGMLDDATDAVRGGSLGDEAAELLSGAGKTIGGPLGETRAAERMDKFDSIVTANIKRIEDVRLTPNYNSLTAYSPSGMRVRETKVVQTTSHVITSAIMRNGGTADEVADFFHFLAKATDADKGVRLDAWDNIMTLSNRYGLGRYPFSDDMIETGILLKNLTEDKDLLGILKAGKGDLAKTVEIMDRTFQRAVEKQIPTYTQLKKASEAVRAGGATAEAEKLAETYANIKPTAKALWNLHEGKIGSFKQGVNSFLGKFFFAQPGFVARNASNNFVTMFVDQGLSGTAKSFFRDGKYWSVADIEDDLMKYFGGKLPPAAAGITLSQSENAGSVVTRLNDAVESGFAKRIYHKNFRDTMDKFLTPGVALPKREEFKALGMVDDQIDHLVHIVRNETYGNIDQAIVKYSEKYGENGLLDVWKRWNGSVSKDEMKGLTELGLTKQLDSITSSAKTPAEIKEQIAKLKKELSTRANSAVDNPIGVNRERKGFEFMEGIGQAEKEGLLDVDGTNKLNILIEQSERTSDELMKAIGKARDIVQEPALRQQFGVMEEAFSASRRGTARATSQGLTDTAWAYTKKARKSTGLGLEQMWNETILAKTGPAPAGLTQQQFLDQLWQATRNDVSNTWEVYFSEGFDRLSPLVENLTQQFPEMQSIFAKSQKSSAELQMYRTAIYRDGKIFYSQPPRNVFDLASRYGFNLKAESGANKDKQLLNTINKYSDVKYKTLDEIPLEEAERALQARATQKGTEAAKLPTQTGTPQKTPGKMWDYETVQKRVDDAPFYKKFDDAIAPKEDSVYRIVTKEEYQDALKTGTLNPGKRGDAGGTVNFSKKPLPVFGGSAFMEHGLLVEVPINKIEGTLYGNVEDLYLASNNPVPIEDVTKAWGFQFTGGKGVQIDEITDLVPKQVSEVAQAVPAQAADELGKVSQPTPNPEVEIQPPYVDGSTPIPGQMWKENSDGIIAALNKVEAHMLDNYGMKAVDKLDGSQLKALKGLMKDSGGRITEGVAIADKIGKEWRDFALLPYGETKNFDLALSYAFPYQFWYSRSYTNWMKRVATDPQVIANYARIKEAMSRVNKDSPEWWRYNVEIPSHFLGLPNEHPMSFNLEANIWPLYGLTGTDFEDPQKRQNWLTSTVDDMGKFGPSLFSPIQWGIALAYRAKGENELAQSWAGRVIPQTATIKAVSSYFGKPLELDPAVQLFSGKGLMDFEAMDKYERNRVGRALTGMVQRGELTEEQMMEVARTQDGAAWDEAVKRATQIRAPGQIMSYFFGTGMKARTEEDRITDEFYQQYYRLNNLNEADLISPTDYQKGWDALREKYPFMDALLLSRKTGPDRDRAYAYNVLGRIPPGQASEIYRAAGIDPKTAQQFYDSKGNIKGWSTSEKDKFMAAMVDIGAMLAIPDYATRTDWADARTEYKAMRDGMKQTFGADIQDKIDDYFGIDNTDQRKTFLQSHPEVQQALDWQNGQIVNNDTLYAFYGGISTIEKFEKGKVYDALEAKYGADIQEKFDQYYSMQITDPAGAKSFYRKHPELKAYSKEKTKLMEEALRKIVEFGAKLPEQEPATLTGNEPNSVAQQGIQDYVNTPPSQPYAYWQQALPEVSAVLVDFYQSGKKIPYAVTKNLDYEASKYGFNSGEDLMQAILISSQR